MNPADADYQNQLRDLARALFRDPRAHEVSNLESDEERTPSNRVSSEGKTTPAPPRDQMRDFTRDLFGYDD